MFRVQLRRRRVSAPRCVRGILSNGFPFGRHEGALLNRTSLCISYRSWARLQAQYRSVFLDSHILCCLRIGKIISVFRRMGILFQSSVYISVTFHTDCARHSTPFEIMNTNFVSPLPTNHKFMSSRSLGYD